MRICQGVKRCADIADILGSPKSKGEELLPGPTNHSLNLFLERCPFPINGANDQPFSEAKKANLHQSAILGALHVTSDASVE